MDQAEQLRTLVKMKDKIDAIKQNGTVPQGKIAKIIAITSGKGGVGKSNITINLALSLAKESKKKVLVLDADFGTANIDIILGIFPKYNISHMFYDNKTLEDIIIEGPYGIKILPGVSGITNFTSLTESQKEAFFAQLEKYQNRHNLDYILVDTGAGISNNVVNFLLAADEIIVIVTPEPTSLADAYAIIKIVHNYDSTIKTNIVVNMVRNEEGSKRVFNTLQSVSEKFLDKHLNFLGYLKFDKHLSEAVRMQKPIILSYPHSDISMEILQLSKTIENKKVEGKKSIKGFFEIAGKYFGWNHD